MIRSILRRLRPRRVQLTEDNLAGSPDELLGHPGRVTRYRMLGRDGSPEPWEADACCPGCGQQVVNLPAATHPLVGDDGHLSCPGEMNFRVCCGWRGRLKDGWWLGR